MKIEKLRLGFANNSSSSHSIVILDNMDRVRNDDEDGQYGWSTFTLTENSSRERYFSVIFRYSLEAIGFNEEQVNLFMKEIFSCETEEGDYIDHQSVFTFPRGMDGNISVEFLRDFLDYCDRNNVVVLGGNDNDGEHPLSSTPNFDLTDNITNLHTGLLCRKNKSTGSWTLFNSNSGAKTTINFNSKTMEAPPNTTKSDYPELVDLKISDYCPYGCSYCYMGSTKSGRHASFDDIKKYVDILSEWGVFEIALGGGEPTLHPNFKEIVLYIKEKNMVANFTTRNLTFLLKEKKFVKENCGSLAISFDTAEDLQSIKNTLRFSDLDKSIQYQYVMGINPLDELSKIFKLETRITLLGFKTTGRGEDYIPNPYEGWVTKLKSLKYPYITIDTALAKQSEEEFKKHKIDNSLYHVEEGKFSCYLDCVKNQIGKSSYEELAALNSGNLKDNILDTYKTY